MANIYRSDTEIARRNIVILLGFLWLAFACTVIASLACTRDENYCIFKSRYVLIFLWPVTFMWTAATAYWCFVYSRINKDTRLLSREDNNIETSI